MIVIGGNDQLAASQFANQLTEWLDSRTVRICAPDVHSPELTGRPFLWPYWQLAPGHGQITIVVHDWTTRTAIDAAHDEISGEKLRARLKSIRQFEEYMAAQGVAMVKVWIDSTEKTLRKRAREDRGTEAEEWSVNPDELLLTKKNVHSRTKALRATASGKNLPWKVVLGGENKHRDLQAGLAVVSQLKQAGRRKAASRVKKPSSRSRGLLESATAHPTLDKKNYSAQIAKLQNRLGHLTRLAAQRGVSTVLAIEGPDAAGKGGAIRRLCGKLDAAHYRVHPTPAPTSDEKMRPYLWRFWNKTPWTGHMAIFDRSWYGRVMVERVEKFATEAEWARAYTEINDYEARLAETGIIVLKIWINISKDEQLRRFRSRENSPHKRHKMTSEDYRNRRKWDDNLKAAEDMIARTDTPHAPWIVISGDDKRYARVAVLKAACRALADRFD
jgi:polyphosphate kinase 2 (PPK2 family)